MADEPREAQDQREVGQRDQLKGNFLRAAAMDANVSRIEVGNGGGRTAVDKFNLDGPGVGLSVRIHSLLSSFTFSLESVPHLR